MAKETLQEVEAKMKSGELYQCNSPELFEKQWACNAVMYEFNHTSPMEQKKREELAKKLFGTVGKDSYVEPPVYANWGINTHLGDNVYVNFGLTLVDDTDVYIGNHVMIGPNVTIATAGHPTDPELRKQEMQFNRPVHIGDNAWIGAGAIILPGVTIGANTTIGAGSVVTKDIPANVVAFGNPCKVQKEV